MSQQLNYRIRELETKIIELQSLLRTYKELMKTLSITIHDEQKYHGVIPFGKALDTKINCLIIECGILSVLRTITGTDVGLLFVGYTALY